MGGYYDDKNKFKMNERIKTTLTILLVVLIGLMCLYYIAKLTAFNEAVIDPCGVCLSIPENSHLKPCFEDASNVLINPITGEQIFNDNIYKINFTPKQ